MDLCGICNATVASDADAILRPRLRIESIRRRSLWRWLLYGMGNMSFRMIGRLLGVPHVAVFEWIKAEAGKLPRSTARGSF